MTPAGAGSWSDCGCETAGKEIPRYAGADHSFDPAAACYAHRPDYPRVFYNALRARLGPLENGRVLDLGCGDARVALRVARWGPEVLAVDLSAQMVSAAAGRVRGPENPGVHLLRGDAARLPFPAGTIDAVLMGQAFHWMRREWVAREVARVLQPRGLWAVFWVQPVKPLPLPAQIADALIAEVVPGYDPDAAHDLTSKSRIPARFGFQVRTWTAEFACQYRLEDYVGMVVSKSYVAAALSAENAVEFRVRLARQLERNRLGPIVEERYLLTAYLAGRPCRPDERASVAGRGASAGQA